jgi:hypothetical protein
MKRTLLTFFIGVLMAAAPAPQTFTGIVTDTMCGAKHGMLKGQPDDQCIKMCVKGTGDYALYDGKKTWKLSDQKAPARFAARSVKVVGSSNESASSIKVISIEADQ